MADLDPISQTSGSLEALQIQSAHARRSRPPELDMTSRDESRVPLRSDREKLGKRESRLGLRSIFGRSKTTADVDVSSSLKDNPSRGIRASLAEIGNWPYGLHAARSELSLPTSSRPLSTAFVAPPPVPDGRPKKSSTPPRSKTPTPTTRSGRGSLASWDPPPLFQAYPQAIRHVQLPACTSSAEALHRLQGGKGSLPLRDSLDEDSADKGEKAKKRHRRNTSASSLKLDWTTKIYVLVTSGYLLQYTGEGSFDRLPEKILNVGKDSAAFASDLIPGKHWVLQVSSAMESDGTQATDSRSLFSRLPFRGSERRQASTFLMVFESAEEMEGWITTLRREIEHLGGKKSLSETGKPKADDNVLQLRAQPSQRTLVVRDPERFSRIINPQDLPWIQTPTPEAPDVHLDGPEEDGSPDTSLDDVSTTNSMVSQDGRQLDNLRDSANRLSYISSGQRTFLTSEGSSPPGSPFRDSFASQDESSCVESQPQARPRPNASAILDRRQSMQTMSPLTNVQIAQTAPPRPLSVYSTSWHEADPAAAVIPNFSVPHSSGRRYSLVKSPPTESAPLFSPPPVARIPPARGARRPPPPSLGFSRPLSIVADQPSPGATPPQLSGEFGNPLDEAITAGRDATLTPAAFASMERRHSQASSQNDFELPSRKSSLAQIQVTTWTSPKRHASLQTLRHSSGDSGESWAAETRHFVHPGDMPMPMPPPPPSNRWSQTAEDMARCKSSLDTYGRARSRSPRAAKSRDSALRRASMYSRPAEALAHRSLVTAEFTLETRQPAAAWRSDAATAASAGAMIPRSSASSQHLRAHSASKALLYRRSMPQLVEGPPPAPPPTCALPPLPPKRKSTSKTRPRAIAV